MSLKYYQNKYFLEKILFASQNYKTEAYKTNWLTLSCISHYLPQSVNIVGSVCS